MALWFQEVKAHSQSLAASAHEETEIDADILETGGYGENFWRGAFSRLVSSCGVPIINSREHKLCKLSLLNHANDFVNLHAGTRFEQLPCKWCASANCIFLYILPAEYLCAVSFSDASGFGFEMNEQERISCNILQEIAIACAVCRVNPSLEDLKMCLYLRNLMKERDV